MFKGKWIANIGLNLSHQRSNFHTDNTKTNISHNFTYLIPNANISLLIPKASQHIQFSYDQGLITPTYEMLNPFIYKSSSNSIRFGNPDLKPFVTHSFSLEYLWNSSLVIRGSYNTTKNPIQNYSLVKPNGSVEFSFANFGREKSASLYAEFKKLFFKRWQISMSVNGAFHYNHSVYITDFSYKNYTGSFQTSHQLALWPAEHLDLNLSFSLHTPTESTLGKTKWQYSSSINISKKWGKSWQTSVLINNPIASRHNILLITDEYKYYSKATTLPFSFTIDIRYTFGSQSINKIESDTSTTLDARMK